MAKPNAPSTTWVSQRPRDAGLLETWFDSVGGFIQGIQSQQTNDLVDPTGATIGTCKSIRLANLAYVQGTLTVTPGTDIIVSGVPLVPDAPVAVTAAEQGTGVGQRVWMLANDSSLHLTPTVSSITFLAWYTTPVQKH